MMKLLLPTMLLLACGLQARQLPTSQPVPVLPIMAEVQLQGGHSSPAVAATTAPGAVSTATTTTHHTAAIGTRGTVARLCLGQLSASLLAVPRLVQQGVRTNLQKMQHTQNSFDDFVLLVGAGALVLAGVFYLGHLIFPYSLGLELASQIALGVGSGLLGIYVY